MYKEELLRTDRNGTKYYAVTCTCGKCGGRGIIDYYIPINGGDCFDCGGSGVISYTTKVYTPEYEKKLEERRRKKAEKKLAEEKAHAAEKNAEFFEKNGFSPDGKTYFVLGNTFDIKDELKAAGAKWDNTARHWHLPNIPQHISNLNVLEVSVENMYYSNTAGVYDWRNWRNYPEPGTEACKNYYCYMIQDAEDRIKAEESTSEYMGNIGEKLSVVVSYIHTASWENSFGGWLNHTSYTNLHTFKDKEGNIYVWKTDKYIEADYGDILVLTGTIKDHNEYKGVKQTVLTRCKVEKGAGE